MTKRRNRATPSSWCRGLKAWMDTEHWLALTEDLTAGESGLYITILLILVKRARATYTLTRWLTLCRCVSEDQFRTGLLRLGVAGLIDVQWPKDARITITVKVSPISFTPPESDV